MSDIVADNKLRDHYEKALESVSNMAIRLERVSNLNIELELRLAGMQRLYESSLDVVRRYQGEREGLLDRVEKALLGIESSRLGRRWVTLRRTSNSGKTLFVCTVCGRVSPTPDKECRTFEDPEERWCCSMEETGAIRRGG